jgi:hypothetical protein
MILEKLLPTGYVSFFKNPKPANLFLCYRHSMLTITKQSRFEPELTTYKLLIALTHDSKT